MNKEAINLNAAKNIVIGAAKKLNPTKAINVAKEMNHNKIMAGKMNDLAQKTISGANKVTNPKEHLRMAAQGKAHYDKAFDASKKALKGEIKNLGKAYGTVAGGAFATKGIHDTFKKEKTAFDIVNEAFNKISIED